jgi:GTPase
MSETDTLDQPGAAGSTTAEFRCGFVALVGRANVGKSTLMNRMVGVKLSIVSQVPQTTRFPVRGILNRPGLQIVFIDTPGIHKPRYRMNEEMVRLATRVLREVDLVATLVDASEGFGPGDRFVFDLIKDARSRNMLILNKVDLMPKENLLPLIQEASQSGLFEEIIPVSALTGENGERLEALIASRMPPGPPHFPEEMLTDVPERQAISELIREQVFLQTRQEVPHSTAVVVDLVERGEDGMTRINATIVADKDSQKGILIGEGGRMMKAIGTAARRQVQDYLKTRVHLALWVKVKRGWRDDESVLRLIGLPLS